MDTQVAHGSYCSQGKQQILITFKLWQIEERKSTYAAAAKVELKSNFTS